MLYTIQLDFITECSKKPDLRFCPYYYTALRNIVLNLGGFYLFVFNVASLRDEVLRCLSVTALRLRLVPCY